METMETIYDTSKPEHCKLMLIIDSKQFLQRGRLRLSNCQKLNGSQEELLFHSPQSSRKLNDNESLMFPCILPTIQISYLPLIIYNYHRNFQTFLG